MTKINDPDDLHFLFNELEVAVMIIGRDDGIMRYVNRRVGKDMGKDRAEIQDSHYRQIFWPEFITVYDRLQTACEDGKEHTIIYYWAEMAIWEQISAHTILWNSVPSIMMSITNISEIARSEYKFESMAYFDNMLKLPNGAKLEEDINELASLETVGLVYFAIERFEDINDLYGWDNGDNLLKQIRDWLLASEPRRAQLYRVNNGFALLGRKVSKKDAEDRSNEILRRFSKPWTLSAGGNSLQIFCTIKLGIVYGKYIRNEMRNLLLRTIRGGETGDHGFAIYDEKADREAKRSLILRDTLINSVFNDMKGFDVHYHPIVDIKSQQWVALEALCRWTRADGERVSPMEFIPIAEQFDLIGQVDCWVRKTAMSQCVALRLDKKHFMLDVNFSPTQKIDASFIRKLSETFDETRFPPEKLGLEITESTRMAFDKNNLEGLNRLKESGIRLSLDDFGTGYSSFENLIKVSAHALKTEKLFLDGIEQDDYRQYLLNTLVNIAHYLDMLVISEGVETEAQLELLKKYGVDYAQGYLFSEPLPYAELKRESWRFR